MSDKPIVPNTKDTNNLSLTIEAKLILQDLRDQVGGLERDDDEWAPVELARARDELQYNAALFDINLNLLKERNLYKEVDREIGLVYMGELPSETE